MFLRLNFNQQIFFLKSSEFGASRHQIKPAKRPETYYSAGKNSNMPTNFDAKPWLATRGQRVRSTNCPETSTHPPEWDNVGVVTGIVLDKLLTKMNKKNIQMYRIIVDFGGAEPASFLPSILKRVTTTNSDSGSMSMRAFPLH